MFKANNKNSRKRHWSRSSVFVNFEHISHLFLVFFSNVDFEQVNVIKVNDTNIKTMNNTHDNGHMIMDT